MMKTIKPRCIKICEIQKAEVTMWNNAMWIRNSKICNTCISVLQSSNQFYDHNACTCENISDTLLINDKKLLSMKT